VLRRPEVPAAAVTFPVSPVSFAASPRRVLGLAAGALAAGLAVIFVDRPGRILLVVVAAGLLVESVRLAVLRPVLSVDAEGVQVRALARPQSYRWTEVGPVIPRTSRRLVTTKTLDLDLGETLVVIPGYRLGADPADVAAAIEMRRPITR
jgi:hypothetical protein